MKKLLLAALVGSAAAVAPAKFDISTVATCETDDECRLWGDSSATCDFNTKKCVCTPQGKYVQPTVNTQTLGICVHENADALAKRFPLVFTIQYPRGSCNVTDRETYTADYKTTLENTIGKTVRTSFSCAEPSGVNVAVLARMSVNDVFTLLTDFPLFWQPGGTGSKFTATSALVSNYLGSQSKFPQVNNHKGRCNMDYGATQMGRVDDMCISIDCDDQFDLINGKCILRTPARSEDDDIPDGVLVAIVLGALLFVALITAVIVCLRAYRRPVKKYDEEKLPLKDTPTGPDVEDEDEY